MKTPKFFLLPLAGMMLAAGAASAQTVASGTTGSCTWAVTGTSDSLTLTISGAGAMGSYNLLFAPPWDSCRNGITALNIGQGVTSIGSRAFSYCRGLTSVSIPASVTSISVSAFANCSGLTAINVDADNASFSVEDGVLLNKDKTTLIYYPTGKKGSYTIPASVTSIGSEAFRYCSGLTSVTIPASVTSIGNGAFGNCSKLTTINVDADNANFSVENSVLFNKNKATLICCPAGKTGSYAIPASVTSIDQRAFAGCSGLTSVSIPASVTSIGLYAFSACSVLTAINVSAANASYASEDGVLLNKNKTTLVCYPVGRAGSYTIPASVTHVGIYAFSGCRELTSVTIPASVTSIGVNAFEECSGLTSITNFSATPQSITISNIFRGAIVSNIVLTVPTSSVEAYQSANGWRDFQIEEIAIFTLTFDAQGGTVITLSQTVISDSAVGALPVPTRSGYIFIGWYTAPNGAGTLYTDSTAYSATSNTTLYAKWAAAYTLTFDAQSGTVTPGSKIVASGEVVGELPVPVRGSYAFGGWYTAADGKGLRYTESTVYSALSNTTLYAKWVVPYTLTFNAQGGTVNPSSQTVLPGEAVGVLPVPTRDDYTFGGWYAEPNGAGLRYTESTMYNVLGNTTLYAKWTAGATGVAAPLQASVRLYPNPFVSTVHLTGAAGCTLTVITAAGTAVHIQAVGSAEEAVALEQLPPGVYFFRLEKDGKSCTVKGYKR